MYLLPTKEMPLSPIGLFLEVNFFWLSILWEEELLAEHVGGVWGLV